MRYLNNIRRQGNLPKGNNKWARIFSLPPFHPYAVKEGFSNFLIYDINWNISFTKLLEFFFLSETDLKTLEFIKTCKIRLSPPQICFYWNQPPQNILDVYTPLFDRQIKGWEALCTKNKNLPTRKFRQNQIRVQRKVESGFST